MGVGIPELVKKGCYAGKMLSRPIPTTFNKMSDALITGLIIKIQISITAVMKVFIKLVCYFVNF